MYVVNSEEVLPTEEIRQIVVDWFLQARSYPYFKFVCEVDIRVFYFDSFVSSYSERVWRSFKRGVSKELWARFNEIDQNIVTESLYVSTVFKGLSVDTIIFTIA